MKIPYRILCVCMGNVCRSPTAEAVLKRLLSDSDLRGRIEVASAGTHGYRVGEASDARIQRIAWARGYDLSQIRAQKIGWQDLDCFDLILAMDKSNFYNLRRMATEAQQGKTRLLMDYATTFDEDEVPDPYTALGQSFERTLDMIEDAAKGVVERLHTEIGAEVQVIRLPARTGS
ncbi:MAG: low molecular weight phosphotyrosine protein phosphatase [Dechloromonas sp.]|uniref:protein-tyrosine-phosphatase n=1 Tax=Candidatus Dechloromonas phosphorivorans TaxID=2899244 RepID=A0A935K237_9RHOO|nr:low molecular weight phosphotyrosine protein phosphatase [Candidatus Dechloromonas phosphorivorans]